MKIPEAFAWPKMARSRCSECQSVALVWMRADDLVFVVPSADRKRVFEALRWCGQGGDAWRCQDCDAWGVFGPTESTL